MKWKSSRFCLLFFLHNQSILAFWFCLLFFLPNFIEKRAANSSDWPVRCQTEYGAGAGWASSSIALAHTRRPVLPASYVMYPTERRKPTSARCQTQPVVDSTTHANAQRRRACSGGASLAPSGVYVNACALCQLCAARVPSGLEKKIRGTSRRLVPASCPQILK